MMLATIVNSGTVIMGALIGLLLKKHISKDYHQVMSTGVGLISLVLGIRMAFDGGSILIIVPALVLGGILGTALKVEEGILRLGDSIRQAVSLKGKDGVFARGFLDASVLFCVGPMSIIGSIEAGLQQNYDVLFTKSALDGCMAIVLAATLGPGVIASALPILVFQGALTLGAKALTRVLTDEILMEIGTLGGYLIIMIALNLLDIKRTKTANFLPSLICILFFVWGKNALI